MSAPGEGGAGDVRRPARSAATRRVRREARRAPTALAAVALAVTLLPGACAEPPPERPPSFVVVSIDTTRRDHLGLYGYERDTTPHLDALAADALVFDQAVTVSENTLVAHATLFTGLFPSTHGTTHRDGGWGLHPALGTLAEDLRAAGYQTAGFAAHGDWLVPAYGVDQGFETWSCAYRPADAVLTEARAWLDARDPARPFLLFVHLFDVHSDAGPRPYEAPAGFAGRWTSGYDGPWARWEPGRLGGSAWLRAVMDGEIEVDDEALAHVRDQYDEGLAHADDRLGAFLASLTPAERGESYLVVTSDHGEEFGEHGRMLHSSYYDEVVRIPLLLVPPSARTHPLGPPRRLDAQVSLADLRPTLVALAGLPRLHDAQGADLVPWLAGEVDDCPSGPVPLGRLGLRHEGFKLVFDRGGPRVFDLRADPREQRDLAVRPRAPADATDAAAVRQREMTAFLARMEQWHLALREHLLSRAAGGDGVEEPPRPEIDAAAEERLRQIGYAR